MKQFILLVVCLFNMSFVLAQTTPATTMSSDANAKWTGVLWRNGEAPIIAPIAFKSESECKRLLGQMNDIAKNTVHIERQQKCQQFLPEDSKWSGVLWRDGEDPIISPVGFKSETECKKLLTQLNDIAKSTVKVERLEKCQELVPQIRPKAP
jgi:hypothetical protein